MKVNYCTTAAEWRAQQYQKINIIDDSLLFYLVSCFNAADNKDLVLALPEAFRGLIYPDYSFKQSPVFQLNNQ